MHKNCSCSSMMTNEDSSSDAACKRTGTVFSNLRNRNFSNLLTLLLACVRPNSSVCMFKTATCMPAPRAHVETHVRVLLVHSGTYWTCIQVGWMDTPHRHSTTTTQTTTATAKATANNTRSPCREEQSLGSRTMPHQVTPSHAKRGRTKPLGHFECTENVVDVRASPVAASLIQWRGYSPIYGNKFSPNWNFGFLHLRTVLLISLVSPSLPLLILFMTCAAKRRSQLSNGLIYTHSRGALFARRSSTFTTQQPQAPRPLRVCGYVFLCEPYVTTNNCHWTRTQKTARILSLGSFWQWGRARSLFLPDTQTRSHGMQTDCLPFSQQLSEQSACTWLKMVYDCCSHQETKEQGQVVDMTKRMSPVTDRRYFRPHGRPCIYVLQDEVLLYCHETGDCHAVPLRASSEQSPSLDCQAARARDWSELLQSAGDCQSERSRGPEVHQISWLIPWWLSDNTDQKRQNHHVVSNTCPFTKSNEDVVWHRTSTEKIKTPRFFPCLHHQSMHEYDNMRMTQKFQHWIPYVVFVVCIGIRRERGRNVIPINCEPKSKTSESTEPKKHHVLCISISVLKMASISLTQLAVGLKRFLKYTVVAGFSDQLDKMLSR